MTSGQAEEQNPLLQGLGLRRTPDPCVLVIFGASGDLTAKKLMPALYALAYRRLLPQGFAIVGAARSDGSDEQFREQMKEALASGSQACSGAWRRCRSSRAGRLPRSPITPLWMPVATLLSRAKSRAAESP